jgi:hypothetical protein
MNMFVFHWVATGLKGLATSSEKRKPLRNGKARESAGIMDSGAPVFYHAVIKRYIF